MVFNGDLEHLPIVDVIQLLHSSRKSGILAVQSRKGESRLVFKEGYIVSASHLNNSVRIGKILVDGGFITDDLLEKTLREQQAAGGARRPIIVTLVEKGLVREQDAYSALEGLIEMTLLEILTWKKGTFSLQAVEDSVSDDYRYYPAKMSREINVDTQSVLMEALRMYDEKMRDGVLPDTDEAEDAFPLSADDLGLGDLEGLEVEPRKRGAALVASAMPDAVAASIAPREILRSSVNPHANAEDALRMLPEAMTGLRELAEVPEVAAALLRHAAGVFERAVTLIVRQGELVAERGIGVRPGTGRTAVGPLGFRVPLAAGSPAGEAVFGGKPFFGKVEDRSLAEHLHAAIGNPAHPHVLLLPLRSGGKTVSVTYADFGNRDVQPVRLELLEILAAHAGVVVENIMSRKRLARAGA